MKIKNFIIPLAITLLFGCEGSNITSKNSYYLSEESILTNLPDVNTLEKYYFDFTSTTNNLTIELTDIPVVQNLHINGREVSTRHYLYENHILTIGNGYLVGLGYGKHILSINETTHFAIVIYNETEPKLLGSNEFKYIGSSHPKFEIAIYSGEITSLIYNNENYMQYIKSYSNNILQIDATFCENILVPGTNLVKLIVGLDLPNGLKEYEIPLLIQIPKTGDYITGTPEYDEIESDYFTSSEGVIL